MFTTSMRGGCATGELTVMVTSLVAESALSSAMRRRTYVPADEKLAVVASEAVLPNVTVPGPLNLLHCVVRMAGGFGSPSSLAVAFKFAFAGNVMVWLVPALAIGGWLMGGF